MGNAWEQLRLLRPGWTDLFEILLVAFLLYRVLLVLQRTRAMQIMLGRRAPRVERTGSRASSI